LSALPTRRTHPLPGGALAQGVELILIELLVDRPLIAAFVVHQRPVLLVLATGLKREDQARQRERRRKPARSRSSDDLLGSWQRDPLD
jgi:hypothetical protein